MVAEHGTEQHRLVLHAVAEVHQCFGQLPWLQFFSSHMEDDKVVIHCQRLALP